MPIGTLNEQPLHAALKSWYAQPGDRVEESVAGFVIDIVRGDLLIEIQTRHFNALKRKLRHLIAAGHPVRLVYPVAAAKWIVRLAEDPDPNADPASEPAILGRRKSPKRGAVVDVFAELVSVPDLLAARGFALDVLLIHEEELRRHDPKRGWRRRGWVTHQRRLLDVIDRQLFATPADLAALLPADLAEPFSTADLAAAIRRPRRLGQQMAYCLRTLDVITPVGKRGNAILYARGKQDSSM